MASVTEDWELTSGRDARSEISDMDAHQETSGALPTAEEVLAAIEAHADPSDEPSGILRGSSSAATAAVENAEEAVSEAPNAPASVTTTIINELLESGGHRPEPVLQQQQPQQQQHSPESIARAKWWDKQIAEGNLSMLPEITTMHVNIMAWGESGLGKTTFIKNLVQGWGVKSMGAAFESGGRTSPEQFRRDPASMRLETLPIIDKGASKGLVISIQDMPGWGDEIDLVSNLKTVVQFLLEQRKKDLLDNKAGVTECHPCPGTVMKHGITVCLYFLPPQRAKELDWYMLEGISSLVAVVPVIAKADTHTAPELEAYRREVIQAIERATSQAASADTGSTPTDIPPCPTRSLITPFKSFCFDPSDLEAVQARGPLMPPFAVMGSQSVLGPEESTQGPVGAPYRRYLWGIALPLDRDHSDLIILKQLLTGHQNRAVYGLLNDSWARAHAFYKRYEQLKRVQLEAKVADGQLGGSVDAILSAVEGLDVDMSPLVAEVCGSISSFGGGEQQLQDRLRCEEQQRLEVRLRQAQGELLSIRKSSVSPLKFRVVIALAVVLAFLLGALVAYGVGYVYFGWRVGGEAEGACAALGGEGAFGGAAVNATFAPVGAEHPQPMPPPSTVHRAVRQDCHWKTVRHHGVLDRVRVCNQFS